MIEHTFDAVNAILYVHPKSALNVSDFTALAKSVDPYIEQLGGLAGLIVEIRSFPGWDSFAALIAHLRFVRDHHRMIKKVAVVTDSALVGVAERLASHFVAAEIRHFPAGQVESAREWILNN
jgi:hypothetical protein